MSIYSNLISTCGHRIGVATAIVLTILTVKGAVVIARPEKFGLWSLFCADKERDERYVLSLLKPEKIISDAGIVIF